VSAFFKVHRKKSRFSRRAYLWW